MKKLPVDISSAVETLKGGKGSGNHGHGGLAGVHGGSSPSKKAISFWDGGANGLNKYIMDTFGYSSVHVNDTSIRSRLKSHIVTELSGRTGLGHQDVNGFIGEWANTSNKSEEAFLLQKTISEELGAPMSDWQKDRFRFYEAMDEEYHELVGEFSEICLDTFSKEDFSITKFNALADSFSAEKSKYIKDKYGAVIGIETSISRHRQFITFSIQNLRPYNESWDEYRDLEGHFGYGVKETIPFNVKENDYINGIKWFLGVGNKFPIGIDGYERDLPRRRAWKEEKKNDMAKFVRETYAYTQETLKKVYPNATHITLYRGVNRLPKDYKTNASEAWSLSEETAKIFSTGSYLKVDIPISRVYSSCLSGVGCLNEYEFVILGGNYSFEFLQGSP